MTFSRRWIVASTLAGFTLNTANCLSKRTQGGLAARQMSSFVKIKEIRPHREVPEAHAVGWSPNGQRIAVLASVQRYAEVFDVASGSRLAATDGFAGGTASIAFIDNDQVMVPPRHGEGGIALWDLRDGRVVDIPGPSPRSGGPSANLLLRFDLDAGRSRLAGVHLSAEQTIPRGRVAVFDVRGWTMVADFAAAADVIAIRPDGDSLAVCRSGGGVALIDLPGGAALSRFQSSDDTTINSLAWSPEGQFLVGGSTQPRAPTSSTLRVWRAFDGAVMGALGNDIGGVAAVAVGPGGLAIIASTSDGGLREWSGPALQREVTIERKAQAVATSLRLSPSGRTLAAVRSAIGSVDIYARRG